MILIVRPADHLQGTVRLPASKSYSIRAFLIAACGGNSSIIAPSNCDDALVAIRTARRLGAEVKKPEPSAPPRWRVKARRTSATLSKINVGESGTVLRFLLPLAALDGRKATITGEGTLRGRPNVFLTRTLRKMGLDIRGAGRAESIPVRIKGGRLRGGTVTIDGTLSSQFISALLIACPQLPEDTRLRLAGGTLVSADYITMTRQTLRRTGVTVKQNGPRLFGIRGRQKFRGLKDFTVPSDYGLAAFLMAATLLNRSDVKLTGSLKDDLLQADGRILSVFRKMCGRFQKTSKAIRIKGPVPLKGGRFSLKDCPDLVPVMAVCALFAKGKTHLTDIGHVRSKESDRISDLRKELVKVGAKIRERRDSLLIEPSASYRPNRILDPHRDHRLAMAFCVLGTKVGVKIKDMECVRKSYPDFVRDLRSLGVSLRKA